MSCNKILEDFSKNMKDSMKIIRVDKDFMAENNPSALMRSQMGQSVRNDADNEAAEPLDMLLKKLKQTQGLKAA